MKIFILLAFFFSPHFSYAIKPSLDALVQKYHEKHRFHGNVLIRKDDQVIFSKSIGEAHVEWTVPHTRDSKFMIASLSKSFTAAMILQLQHQGELQVDDKVSDYILLPQKSSVSTDRWEKLTIKHLLHHTGGLKRDFEPARSDYNLLGSTVFYALNTGSAFVADPGTQYYYSNFGYVLLAAIIESTGIYFYEDQLRNTFLSPLNMDNTGEYHRMKSIKFMTQGYFYGENHRFSKRCCDDATALRGSANLYSTVDDLMTWLIALKNSNDHFGFDLLNEMTSDMVQGDADNSFLYGYGLFKEETKSGTRIHHNGHEWGYVSSMSMYPEHNLEIIVLANRHGFLGYSNFNSADALSLDLANTLIIHH